MITRFRVEGVGDTLEKCREILEEAASKIISITGQDHMGEWECTQDVITGANGSYQGRMVLVFRRGKQ